jgi:AIR synthase-related protein
MDLVALVDALRASRGFAHKHDIGRATAALPSASSRGIAVGDDCAAIPDGDGHLLFAIEGFVDDFVERMPWFAGYCGVMVNTSDVYAMGGRPIAVVDALWSDGADDAAQVLAGMAEAADRYGIPIVGGHTNLKSARAQLSVAVLGRARKLLTSFDARPGDALVMAIDLRGRWQDPFPYWNASTRAPATRLRDDLEVLPSLAEDGLCDAAKDISMAGALGTTLMLLECSRVGATIDVAAIPRPAGVAAGDLRWLTAFPSFGFVLSVRPRHVETVLERFRARDIGCGVVGGVTGGPEVTLRHEADTAALWNFEQEAFMASPREAACPAA